MLWIRNIFHGPWSIMRQSPPNDPNISPVNPWTSMKYPARRRFRSGFSKPAWCTWVTRRRDASRKTNRVILRWRVRLTRRLGHPGWNDERFVSQTGPDLMGMGLKTMDLPGSTPKYGNLVNHDSPILGYVVYFLENRHQALAFWSWAKSYFKLRSFSAQPLFDFGFGSSCVL